MLLFPSPKSLKSQLPPSILELMTLLNQKGFTALLVGGALRSLLLKKEPADFDLLTNASLEDLKNIFDKTLLLGEKYDMITIFYKGYAVEVKSYAGSNNLKQDLEQRDFTINAMAFSASPPQLFDFFGGQRDLRRRYLRAVQCPAQCFASDYLRMLRCFRLMGELNLKIDPQLLKVISSDKIKLVSPERQQQELNKLLLTPYLAKALANLFQSNLLYDIIPEFKTLKKFPSLLNHIIKTTVTIKPQLHMRYLALLHDIGKGVTYRQLDNKITFHGHEKIGADMALNILTRLRFSNKFIQKITHLIKMHMIPCNPYSTDRALRKLLKKVGHHHIFDLIELRRADIVASTQRFDLAYAPLKAFQERIESILSQPYPLKRTDLAVNGNDIMRELKLPQGKKVGAALEKAWDWVLADINRNTYSQIINYLKNND